MARAIVWGEEVSFFFLYFRTCARAFVLAVFLFVNTVLLTWCLADLVPSVCLLRSYCIVA
jgi:hypothetical protein